MSSDGSDLRQRYAEALRTAAKDAIVGEASAPSKMLDAVMAVRDEELERLRVRATNFYDAIGRAVAERDEWRERAETARSLAEELKAEAEQGLKTSVIDSQRAAWKTQAHVAGLFLAALDDSQSPTVEPETPAGEETETRE